MLNSGQTHQRQHNHLDFLFNLTLSLCRMTVMQSCTIGVSWTVFLRIASRLLTSEGGTRPSLSCCSSCAMFIFNDMTEWRVLLSVLWYSTCSFTHQPITDMKTTATECQQNKLHSSLPVLTVPNLAAHTHTRLTALCPGLPGWAGTRKVKPIWILLEQETVSGSGISWAICKSASRSRQITTPAPYYSSFLQAGCPSCRPTNSVKALKAQSIHVTWQKFSSIFIPLPIQLIELEALCFWFVRLSCSYVCACSDAFSVLLAIYFWYPDIVYH